MEPSDQPRVLSADGDLLAIYKPSGWVSHGTGMEGESRLDEWVELATSTSGQTPIHRLDKPVSGLVLFSADAQMRARIGALFTHRETQKKYTALVHGRTRRKGNLKRGLKDPRRGQVLDALTRYRLLRWLGPFSLLEVRPETGRKHQIRRHLQGVGHGIVGDERYRQRGRSSSVGIERIWLHASALELPDGRRWEAELSPELVLHLDTLEQQYGIDG